MYPRRMRLHLSLVAISLLTLVACGSSSDAPADVSGTYSLSITDTKNDCNYQGWTIGSTAQNVGFVVTQNGTSASGDVQGLAAAYTGALGIGTLQGSVDGNVVGLSATGTTSVKSGSCAFFVKMSASFTLTGNAINGTIDYTNITNNDASCGNLSTCVSEQTISGSRPPK